MRRSSSNQFVRQRKFHDRNFIALYSNGRYFETVSHLLRKIHFDSVLDAGCGEGASIRYIWERFHPQNSIIGFDLDPRRANLAMRESDKPIFFVSNVQNIPFPKNSFDLVICLETLEHVGEPDLALAEITRVSKKYALFSVPNEPWWRLGNILRGKYWNRLGNTPGHINHWTVMQFRTLLERHFFIIDSALPVLWNFVLATKKDE